MSRLVTGVGQKNPTPTPNVVRKPTPTQPKSSDSATLLQISSIFVWNTDESYCQDMQRLEEVAEIKKTSRSLFRVRYVCTWNICLCCSTTITATLLL